MLRFLVVSALATGSAVAQQAGVSLSPFVTFAPSGGASSMAGLALSVADGPLALRAGGHLSLQERSALTGATAVTMRPWGADADALALLESYNYGDHISLTPYVFAGVSTTTVDSGARRFNQQGWSYGGGFTLPMGSAFGLFSETRWRMSRYVMPNSDGAPSAIRELRIGASFRVGGGGKGMSDVVPVISLIDGAIVQNGATATNSTAARLLSTAAEYVGTPYRRGGTSPSSGFDASGFVRFVFSRLGVTLPRASRDQARVGERVRTDLRSLEPGDLVMFEDEGGINHVAIFVGRSRIIHATETGGGVRYDDLTTDRGRWFLDHLAAARRVLPSAAGLLLDLARGFPSDVANADVPDHAPRVPAARKR